MRGRVADGAGAPVADARIHLERGPTHRQFEDVVTSDGCFDIGHVVAPDRYHYRVHITATGFKPAQGRIRAIEDNRVIVVLQRATESGRSSFALSKGDWPKKELTAPCSGSGID